MTDKRHILAEIKRLADSNGGKPPGVRLFERETGIKESDWYPLHWLRWGDAVQEAGFARNVFQQPFSEESLAENYAKLVAKLGRLPLQGELIRESNINPGFPSEKTFRRFKGKGKLLKAVVAFCHATPDFENVLTLCEAKLQTIGELATTAGSSKTKIATGFVYLMKSGKHHKIGRTNSMGRREWELGIKIPIPPTTIHRIETDDPVGVEAYWHKRFEGKRGEGEWFILTPEDISAFKRWKKLV
jgi:hypothetical protein